MKSKSRNENEKLKFHGLRIWLTRVSMAWRSTELIVSPARKLLLCPAQRHAVLPGGEAAALLDVLRDHEALD